MKETIKINLENGVMIIPKHIRDEICKGNIKSEFLVLVSDVNPQAMMFVVPETIDLEIFNKQVEEYIEVIKSIGGDNK